MAGSIKSFADKETDKVYNQLFSKRLPPSIQRMAFFKLLVIDNAESWNELRVPPSNHLEQLKGNRRGQYSIRINSQYRICFSVGDDGFYDLEITDYH